MNYIILAAGMGKRLKPFTNNFPKCLVNIGDKETVIERCIRLIKKYDEKADITVVVGFKQDSIKERIKGVNFIFNPFYELTNSIASLWFAKDKMNGDTVIFNGDIVFAENLTPIITKKPKKPVVFMDSSIKKDGDYNVQTDEGKVVVMSKELDEYCGEYAGITKLDAKSAKLLREEIEQFMNNGYFTQWYEDVLVQMILNYDFELFFEDIASFEWTEVDSIGHLLLTRKIQKIEK